MVGDQLPGPARRIVDRIAVPGQREPRVERDRRLERAEIVAERVGPAPRPEPHGRRDPAEEMVGGDEHAVAQQHQLAVGMAGRGDGLPAVDRSPGSSSVGSGW